MKKSCSTQRWTRPPSGIDAYEGICDRGEKLYGHLPCLETRSRSVLSEMRGRGESDGGLEEEVKEGKEERRKRKSEDGKINNQRGEGGLRRVVLCGHAAAWAAAGTRGTAGGHL